MDNESWRYDKPGSRIERKQKKNKKKNANKHFKQSPNVAVYNNTKSMCEHITVRDPIFYDRIVVASKKQETVHTPVYEIEDIDTLLMARKYVEDGYNPLVLNMASGFQPGGGVAKGSTAQEEELFRRTTACLSHPKIHYPLREQECIYSPEVWILKDENKEHLPNHERTKFSMIAIPAIKNPKQRNSVYLCPLQDHYKKVFI